VFCAYPNVGRSEFKAARLVEIIKGCRANTEERMIGKRYDVGVKNETPRGQHAIHIIERLRDVETVLQGTWIDYDVIARRFLDRHIEVNYQIFTAAWDAFRDRHFGAKCGKYPA